MNATTIQPQKQFRALLLGETCIDRYVIGDVDRISPEAPIPILSNPAANVKRNLEALGFKVTFYTNKNTIIKTRFVDRKSGQQILRLDDGETVDEWQPWIGVYSGIDQNYDCVVISDYDKGFLTYDHITDLRNRCSLPIFIDTKKTNLAKFSGCIVKINETEYKKATSFPSGTLVVTKGASGAEYYHDDVLYLQYTAPTVNVVDVCGCGDTFLAALAALCVIEPSDLGGWTPVQAASLTATKRGTYAPTLQEIDSFVRQLDK